MFVRVLEMETKPGKAKELCALVGEKGFPILKKFPGFVNAYCLVPEGSLDMVVAMSFWESEEAAEKYRTESYHEVAEIYDPYLEGIIQVRRGNASTAWQEQPKAA